VAEFQGRKESHTYPLIALWVAHLYADIAEQAFYSVKRKIEGLALPFPPSVPAVL